MKTVLETDSGLRISSGTPGTAILSMGLTQAVNSGEMLTLGSVCAAVAEISLMTDGTCPIAQGEEFTLYKEGNGRRWCLGRFTAQKPQWSSRYRLKLTAYDPVAKLDRDMTRALAARTDWPYTLGELARWVCDTCGVPLGSEGFPNAEFPVERFAAEGITGRQILSFIAEAAGRFCRADENGQIIFDWYRQEGCIAIGQTFRYGLETEFYQGELQISGMEAAQTGENLALTVTDHHYCDGQLTLTGVDTLGVLAGKLQLAEETVAPVEKVQIRSSSADVGTMYPNVTGNTYCITGNPLLTAKTADTLLPIAQSIYETLRDVTYTPMTLTVPLDLRLRAGSVVTVTDRQGNQTVGYLMERQIVGGTMTLRCTGTARREDSAVVHHSLKTLSGKVMRLQTDVEGIRAENADAAGNLAALQLSVQGLQGKVTELDDMRESVSTLQQDARSLALELRTVREEGTGKVVTSTGYTFSDEGLRIKKAGMEMENLLDHTGMTVSRGGQTILQADHRGVRAVDVTVGNYLAVAHARFESYETGTACFYI